MSAPSPFSKAAASTGDSLRPKQDSYSPGCSPTPLAHFPLSSSKGIISQCPPRPKDAHAVTPGTYPDPPSHLISLLQTWPGWMELSTTGLGWGWDAPGAAEAGADSKLSTELGMGLWAWPHIQEHTLSRLAIGVLSAFRVDHKL